MVIERTTLKRTLLASALLAAFTQIARAEGDEKTQQTIVVTASPFGAGEGDQILTPAKVLSGDELRNKLGSSLGETLSQELGVSASGFGAGASRPIIRGLEGSRVKILQNGMGVSDVSGLSNDHAVATDGPTARQIEILRGPAALLYGSGAIGGLVNVVNDRIPAKAEATPTGEIEARYGSVDQARNFSMSADGAVGQIGLHADAGVRNADDYKIPGERIAGDPGSKMASLPWSYTRENSGGLGASYIDSWGYVGASASILNNHYGIPTLEGSQIDQQQKRYDVDVLVKAPFAGFETFRFKAGHTDYKHTELDLEDVPQTNFSNTSSETRWELAHRPLAGWHGIVGIQTENTKFSALNAGTGGPDTVPVTDSRSTAGFVVEERNFGALHVDAGLRLESVTRKPVSGEQRSFHLASYSVGGLWEFTPGYGAGATASVAQRAPATEELYSSGPHDATGTFDIGNANFVKENSRSIELTLQKTAGLVRWKTNLFQDRVSNFVFGQITGLTFDEDGNPGGGFRQRIFSQAGATIRGAEAELGYNQHGSGWSGRIFADTSRGTLDGGSSLPLQPATRFGVSAGYKVDQWRSGISLVHAQQQDRLAVFETSPTPAYTQLDANFSYVQKAGPYMLTWFAVARNLLNQDIRLSTSVLKDVSPLPGRNLIVGLRTAF